MKVSRIARLSRYVRQNAIAFMALFVALGGTGAYAANTIGSADVIDNSLLSQDVKDGEIKAADIGVNQVLGTRIVDGTVKAADLADNGVTSTDLTDNGTLSKDIADGAVTSADIKDGTITEDDAQRIEFLPFGANTYAFSQPILPGQTFHGQLGCEFAEDTAVGGGHQVTNADGTALDAGGIVMASNPTDTDDDGRDDHWVVGVKNTKAEGNIVAAIFVNCVELRPEAVEGGAAKGTASRSGGRAATIKPVSGLAK